MSNKKLEICCYTIESSIIAERHDAHRIELCDNYSEGGTTPSYAVIKKTIENVSIPVNVIVRPRGGDFLYSDLEYEIIKEDISKIKESGASGIVIGFLTAEGEIDIKRTKEIVELTKPLEVTFHRAFDMCANPVKAMHELINLGVDRILTSGCKNSAYEGVEFIAEIIKKAEGKIIIMPGSGINEKNIKEIMLKTGASEFHSSAKNFIDSGMKYINKDISMGGKNSIDEFKRISVDGDIVKRMVEILNT